MSEKILLIDGHSILNRAFMACRILQIQRKTYRSSIWIPEYSFSYD